MFNTGYPAYKFNWQDNSGANTDTLFSATTDGLCVPFGFVLAERGTPGQIYFGGAKELNKYLGTSTFDESSPFFTPSTRFMATAMAGQGVEVMRLVDPTAAVAKLGLFVHIEQVPVPQYEKDQVTGARVLDEDGLPVPLLDGSNQPITETGAKLTWSVRALTSQESFDSLASVTGTKPGEHTYPIMGIKVNDPGSYGNRQGFALYSSGTDLTSVAEDIKSVLYRFSPLELPTNVSTTASYILDNFGAAYNDVSFKDVAVHSSTATNYAFKYVLGERYVEADTGDSVLPYEVHLYSANVAALGTQILTLSTELEFTDPYLVDLVSGNDLNGNPYDHVIIDPTSSTVVNESVVNYAVGGSDGVTTFAKLQELIGTWINGSDHGEFANALQHPMTHFPDPGFNMATKYLLFNLLDLRDNLKIDVATQDVSQPVNTKAQDISAGQALLFRAQMHPESVITGVGCTRVGIYAHASKLVSGTAYSGIVPFTINRLVQRRDLDGGTYLKGSSGGRPNSDVTLLRKPVWTSDDEAVRKIAWAASINTVQHADRTTLFYAALRTVYPNDTSLLVDDEVSDRIIYLMKICRGVWAKYAGVRKPPKKLFPQIELDIDNDAATALNGDNIRVTSTVFQTAYDENLGYATSVNLNISGDPSLRLMNFNVIVGRSTD